MSVTVKDFAKTLKISDKVLLERMQLAGLSHKTADDEVTPADKQALLKYLKGNTKTSTVKVGSSGVNVTAKPSAKSASNDNLRSKFCLVIFFFCVRHILSKFNIPKSCVYNEFWANFSYR